MAWIMNDCIILFFLLSLCYCYRKQKREGLIFLATIGYCCLPVLRIGEAGFNSAYCITALLVCFAIIELVKTGWKLQKLQLRYGACMVGAILVTALGWLLNGNPKGTDIVHFIGLAQYVLGVLCLSIFIKQIPNDSQRWRIMVYGIGIITAINMVFTVTQFASLTLGRDILSVLYAYPGKQGPLNDMIEVQYFSRAFGASYSPLVLASIVLLSCGIIMGQVNQPFSWKWILLFSMTLMLGFLAFSKTVMLGILILLVIFAVCLVVSSERRRLLRRFVPYAIATVAVAVLAAVIAIAIGLKSQVSYYYGYYLNPLEAFDSRYGNLTNTQDREPDTTDILDSEETGNMADVSDIIAEHPIIGVGPAPVEGEFLGDSQIMTVLHDGGILAAVCYGGCYLWLVIGCIRRKEYSRVLIIAGLAIACVSIPVLTYGLSIPFVAYCLSADVQEKEKRQPVRLGGAR